MFTPLSKQSSNKTNCPLPLLKPPYPLSTGASPLRLWVVPPYRATHKPAEQLLGKHRVVARFALVRSQKSRLESARVYATVLVIGPGMDEEQAGKAGKAGLEPDTDAPAALSEQPSGEFWSVAPPSL